MMDISRMGPAYQSEGPFATVLLDVGRGTESGAQEQELRVREAGAELSRIGVPDDIGELVAGRLAERVETPAPVSRAIVATRDGVVLDEITHQRVDQAAVTWGPLPNLAGWIQLVDRNLRFAVVLVDHAGGQVTVYNSDVPEPESETTAGGDVYHVHKVPVGGWSYLRYQNETEQVWKRNAEAVVDEARSVVEQGVRLVLVAGEPDSVGKVQAGLEKLPATVVHLGAGGGRADDGGDAARDQAIREALIEYVVERRLQLAHRLKDGLGQASGAVAGIGDVADAFVTGQVETLLLDPAAAATFDLKLTDHPGLDLGAVPPDHPLRADQALVAAAARTNAEVATLPAPALAGTPAAALLRWQ